MNEKDTAKNKAIREFVNDNKPTQPSDKELVIRTGEAEKILYPTKVALSGVISAPAEFYDKRKQLHNADRCHVVYNKKTAEIKLVVDENYPAQNYEVIGKISKNPDLEVFKINSTFTFTVKELMQILKFNRVFFADKDDNNKIVLALQNFKAKVEKTLEDSSNNRGNDAKISITKLEHELQESFMLEMPIFKGGENKKFRVEICVQASDGSVVVWLESRDLKDMEISLSAGMIEEQLVKFSAIVCIEQ